MGTAFYFDLNLTTSTECMLPNDNFRQNCNHTQKLLWVSASTLARKVFVLETATHSLYLTVSVARMLGQVMLKARKEAFNLARNMVYIFIIILFLFTLQHTVYEISCIHNGIKRETHGQVVVRG